MKRLGLVTLICAVGLSGCGSGGGQGSDGVTALASDPARTETLNAGSDTTTDVANQGAVSPGNRLTDDAARIVEHYTKDLKNWAFTQPADLPITGHAAYAGVLGLVIDPSEMLTQLEILEAPDLLSRVAFDVAFEQDRLTGHATDFVDVASDESLNGTLKITGALRRTADPAEQATIKGQATGRLTGSRPDMSLTLDMSADFLKGSSAIAAELNGWLRSSSGFHHVQGGLIAEE